MATRLTHTTAKLGERIGVTRTDGTRVAGRVVTWDDTKLVVTRIINKDGGRIDDIPTGDIAECLSFDR